MLFAFFISSFCVTTLPPWRAAQVSLPIFLDIFSFLLHLILLIVRRATDGPTGCLHLYISSVRTNKTAVFTCCCFVIFRVSMPGVKSTPQRLFWLFFNPPRICSVYLHTNVSADILSRSLFLTVSPLSLSFCVCTFFSRRPVPLLAHLLAGSSKSPMLFSLSLSSIYL